MRVCLNLHPLAPGTWGGVEAFSRQILRHLRDWPGLQLDVLTPRVFGGRIVAANSAEALAPEFWNRLPAAPASSAAQQERLRYSPAGRALFDTRWVPEFARTAARAAYARFLDPDVRSYRQARRLIARGGYGVIHCPYQNTSPPPPYHARLPYVIHLHDLQHEVLPEHFTAEQLARRRVQYSQAARVAAAIVCAAAHVKRDIVRYCQVPETKVFIVPWGPPEIDAAPVDPARQRETRARLELPERFMFYPAAMWEHKNHLRLLEAMQALQDRGVVTWLVLSGAARTAFEPVVWRRAEELGVADRVRRLGYLSYQDLKTVFQLADFIVVPSLYEASSGPLIEAMALGLPVAAGDIADHAELVGDACPLFDPRDARAIAAAIERLWNDAPLRAECGRRAQTRIRAVRSWERFAREMMDVYRFAASSRA